MDHLPLIEGSPVMLPVRWSKVPGESARVPAGSSSASVGLADYAQVDALVFEYQSVKNGGTKTQVSPNW